MPYQAADETEYLPWDTEPQIDATGHHIFNSVSSLLQHWPNTVVRPGHSIAPCIVPLGTTLYHGQSGPAVPTFPDWLAFDSEHGLNYAYWRNGHLFTFSTTRELRLLYFDGSSGAKCDDGCNDTQELLMFGDVRGRNSDEKWPWKDEEERIQILCAWARRHGLDGFVRMEIHFEIMQCNFTDGLKLISAYEVLPRNDNVNSSASIHVADPEPSHRGPGSPGWEDLPNRPHGWRGSLPIDAALEVRVAAKRHDHAPGETRVRILYDKLVTFYDPAVSSLVGSRRGKPRERHRLKGISKADAVLKTRELEKVVRDWNRTTGSGVDWGSVIHVVVERHAQRLELLAHTLLNASFADVRTRAARARAQVLTMLAPHFTTTDVPPGATDGANKTWLAPVVQRCATAHTAGMPTSLLTPQERLIHNAVEDVMHEICRRLGRLFHAAYDVERPDWGQARVEDVVGFMQAEVEALMSWLDWTSAWVKCRPECSSKELCVVPQWPYERGDILYETRRPWCIHMPNV
ncbi:hypothetical protein PENSPDRAFT_643128 [Peniophora sp. CONT]|nr:hypothetical protein PENSPDRAFT_643128 [Peniophora sp. CONT]